MIGNVNRTARAQPDGHRLLAASPTAAAKTPDQLEPGAAKAVVMM